MLNWASHIRKIMMRTKAKSSTSHQNQRTSGEWLHSKIHWRDDHWYDVLQWAVKNIYNESCAALLIELTYDKYYEDSCTNWQKNTISWLAKKRIKHDKTIKYTDTEFLETNSQKTRLTSCGQGGYTLETGHLHIHSLLNIISLY